MKLDSLILYNPSFLKTTIDWRELIVSGHIETVKESADAVASNTQVS